METLDLTRKRINVKIGTETYRVLVPSARQVEQFDKVYKTVKDDQSKNLDLIFKFLNNLGLPTEVAEHLDIESLTILLEHLSGAKKKL